MSAKSPKSLLPEVGFIDHAKTRATTKGLHEMLFGVLRAALESDSTPPLRVVMVRVSERSRSLTHADTHRAGATSSFQRAKAKAATPKSVLADKSSAKGRNPGGETRSVGRAFGVMRVLLSLEVSRVSARLAEAEVAIPIAAIFCRAKAPI